MAATMSDAEKYAILDAERAARLAAEEAAILDAERAACLAAEEAISAAWLVSSQAHTDAVDAYNALMEMQFKAFEARCAVQAKARRAETERVVALWAVQLAHLARLALLRDNV